MCTHVYPVTVCCYCWAVLALSMVSCVCCTLQSSSACFCSLHLLRLSSPRSPSSTSSADTTGGIPFSTHSRYRGFPLKLYKQTIPNKRHPAVERTGERGSWRKSSSDYRSDRGREEKGREWGEERRMGKGKAGNGKWRGVEEDAIWAVNPQNWKVYIRGGEEVESCATCMLWCGPLVV